MNLDALPSLPDHVTRALDEHVILNSRAESAGGTYAFVRSASRLDVSPNGKVSDAHQPHFVQSDFNVPYFHDDMSPGVEPLSPEVALVLSAHDEIRYLGARAIEKTPPPARGFRRLFGLRGLEQTEIPQEPRKYTMGELTGNASEAQAAAVTLAIPALLLPGETREAALFATSILPAEDLQRVFTALAGNPAAALRYLAQLTGDKGVETFRVNHIGSLPKSHEAYFARLVQNSNFGRTAVMRCVSPLGETWDELIETR